LVNSYLSILHVTDDVVIDVRHQVILALTHPLSFQTTVNSITRDHERTLTKVSVFYFFFGLDFVFIFAALGLEGVLAIFSFAEVLAVFFAIKMLNSLMSLAVAPVWKVSCLWFLDLVWLAV
jgi:hypothetical protein